MSASLFDESVYQGLLGDPEIAQLFTETAQLRAMLLVEGALAKAQAEMGIIPEVSGHFIHRAAMELQIDPAGLSEPTARDGVIVPGFVQALRKAMAAPEHAAYAHFGATSQDILDTGLALRLRRVVAIFRARLLGILTTAEDLARTHETTVMAGRTRWQVATPVSLGAHVAQWAMPLVRQINRLDALSSDLLVASLHGASGNAAALGSNAVALREKFAAGLGLRHTDASPHATRDSIVSFGNWMALTSGSLGKIGRDLLLQGQSELRELRIKGGQSSTMPHKSNPVLAENLVTLAAFSRGQAATLSGAMDAAGERDGAAWTLEWLVLPQLVRACGASLLKAQQVLDGLEVDADAMARTMNATKGLMLAEAVTFALARHMPRPDAAALVKSACARVIEGDKSLAEVLGGMLEPDLATEIDLAEVMSPVNAIGDSADQISALGRAIKALPAGSGETATTG